jgi:hypothetical protein
VHFTAFDTATHVLPDMLGGGGAGPEDMCTPSPDFLIPPFYSVISGNIVIRQGG